MGNYEKLKALIRAACADYREPMRYCKHCGSKAYHDESRRTYYCRKCPHEDPEPPEGTIQYFQVIHTIYKTNPRLLSKYPRIPGWDSANNDLDQQSDEVKAYLFDLLDPTKMKEAKMQDHLSEISDMQDRAYRERGLSLQGLRKLYIYVTTPNARAFFYERGGWSSVIISQGEEMDRLLKAAHTERMQAIRAAFPGVENKLREAGIDLIPVEEGMKSPECPRLEVTMHLGKPKKNASFSASLHLEQEVQLVRDPSVKFRLKTWESYRLKRKYKHNGIEWVLDQCIDKFLFYYRYVNQAKS